MNANPNSEETAETGTSLLHSKLRHSKREQHDIDLQTLEYQRQGYSCREIAQKQEVHLNTVHDRIVRAREILRDELQQSRENWQDDQWWRIQQLQTAFWPQAAAGDLQALWGVLRLMGETRRMMEQSTSVDSKPSYLTQALFEGLKYVSNETRLRVVKNLAEGKHPYANDHNGDDPQPPSPGLCSEVAYDSEQANGYGLDDLWAKQQENSFAHNQQAQLENSREEHRENLGAEHLQNFRAEPSENPRAEPGAEATEEVTESKPTTAVFPHPAPKGYHPCPRPSKDPVERARQIAEAKVWAQHQAAWLHDRKAKQKADLKRALDLEAAQEAERLRVRDAKRAERLKAQEAQRAQQLEAAKAKGLARVSSGVNPDSANPNSANPNSANPNSANPNGDNPADVNPGDSANDRANRCANSSANGCANAKGPQSQEKPLSVSPQAPPGLSTAVPPPPPTAPVLLLGTPPPADQSSGVQT